MEKIEEIIKGIENDELAVNAMFHFFKGSGNNTDILSDITKTRQWKELSIKNMLIFFKESECDDNVLLAIVKTIKWKELSADEIFNICKGFRDCWYSLSILIENLDCISS